MSGAPPSGPRPKPFSVPRQPMPEQPPAVRVGNFREVPYGLTPDLAVLEASRCIQCKNPQCVKGCPVGVQIPEFIDLVAKGKFVEAARKIKETNSLPAVCGRVCPQEEQCETPCVLGKKGEPVAIGRLERFVADFERVTGNVEIPSSAPSTGKRVAVVGAGPAGLTVAGDLVRMGHDVTVFEALHEPGGVLMYGIPEFRLPKDIVRAEVDYIRKLGAKLECNAVIGKTITVDELLAEERFDAVFIGTGAGLPYFMNIPGENLVGVYSANEYLTRANLMKAFRFPEADTPVCRGRRVAVVGGGNVAMDAARTAVRLGAEKVYLVYRRSLKEMPARIEEVHHAEEEGIEFHMLTNPVGVPRERGRVRDGGGVPADGAGRSGRFRAAPPRPDAGIGVPPRGGNGDRRHRKRGEPPGARHDPGAGRHQVGEHPGRPGDGQDQQERGFRRRGHRHRRGDRDPGDGRRPQGRGGHRRVPEDGRLVRRPGAYPPSISTKAWMRILVRSSTLPGDSPSSVSTGTPTSPRSRMSSIWRKQNDWT